MSFSLSDLAIGKKWEPQASVSFAGIELVSGSLPHVERVMGFTKVAALSLASAAIVGASMTSAAPTVILSSICILAAVISAKAANALKELVGLGYASAAVAGALAAGTYVVMALGAPQLALYLLIAEAAGSILGGLGYSEETTLLKGSFDYKPLLAATSAFVALAGAIGLTVYFKK